MTFSLRKLFLAVLVCALLALGFSFAYRRLTEVPVAAGGALVFERPQRPGETKWDVPHYIVQTFQFANGATVVCIDGDRTIPPIAWCRIEGSRVRINGHLMAPTDPESVIVFVSRDGQTGKPVALTDRSLEQSLRYKRSGWTFAGCERISELAMQ